MANPQTENGYVKIATEIVEQFCRYRLSGEEWIILWVILRKTYGWTKKEDAISLSQFHSITKMKKPSIIRAIKNLSSKKIIKVSNNANKTAQTYYFSKDYSKWEPLAKKLTLAKVLTKVSKKANKKLAKVLPTTTTIITKYIYTPEFDSLWKDYPNQLRKKESFRNFKKTVKNETDLANIKAALKTYKKHLSINTWKQPMNGSTWFNNWEDWINYKEPVTDTQPKVGHL